MENGDKFRKNPMDFMKYIWKTKYHSELIGYLIIGAYVWKCYRTDMQNGRRKEGWLQSCSATNELYSMVPSYRLQDEQAKLVWAFIIG